MHIFDFRDQLIADYASYINSFIQISDPQINQYVQHKLQDGALWPEPLIQLNPLFAPGESIDELVAQDVLHPGCASIFRKDKTADDDRGRPLRLHRHQSEAVRVACSGASYVLTTGTGSGKSLAYIIPIVDYVLRHGSRVYRTKRVILEIYDEMRRAMKTEVPYNARLVPPAADAGMRHRPRESRETFAKQ